MVCLPSKTRTFLQLDSTQVLSHKYNFESFRTLEDCVNGGRKANGTEPNSPAAGTVLLKYTMAVRQTTRLSYHLSIIEIKIMNYLLVDSSSLHWLRRNVPVPALSNMCSDLFVQSIRFGRSCISCLKTAQRISFL